MPLPGPSPSLIIGAQEAKLVTKTQNSEKGMASEVSESLLPNVAQISTAPPCNLSIRKVGSGLDSGKCILFTVSHLGSFHGIHFKPKRKKEIVCWGVLGKLLQF